MTDQKSLDFKLFVLISFFSMSSWLNIIAIWVELPIMVHRLPERWSLPSILTLAIQCSNVAPALYSISKKVKSYRKISNNNSNNNEGSQQNQNLNKITSLITKDFVACTILIGISIFSSICTTIFWHHEDELFGKKRSVALIILLTLSSLSSCTSSLVYLPFMSHFSYSYLSAFYFGQGLSGLIPGLIGLAQGLGGVSNCINITINDTSNIYTTYSTNNSFLNFSQKEWVTKAMPVEPRFSVDIFLSLITVLLVISLASLIILKFKFLKTKSPYPIPNLPSLSVSSNDDHIQQKDVRTLISTSSSTSSSSKKPIKPSTSHLPTNQIIFYLVSMALINMAVNGIIPASQSYTCLAYSSVVYALTVRLSSIVSSLSSLSTLVLPSFSLIKTLITMVIAILILIFHLVIASFSPQPPLRNSFFGPILIVTSALIMSSIFSFNRVTIASMMHKHGGRKALLWCGVVTQAGSFGGAMFSFILINVLHVFKKAEDCHSNG